MKKVVGWKVPCKPRKDHSVYVFSGICSYCGKQITEPDIEGKKDWGLRLIETKGIKK